MSVVEEVKSRINIVEVVSRYTPLRRAGTIHKGLCPFHSERTPSFVVYEQSGTWHCFGSCATGGDVFSFLMKKEGLTFREALERLAREAGVSLEEDRPDPGRSQRDALYQVNAAAARYFRTVLQSDPRATAGRGYLERRGINEATAEAFGLGFALDQWSGLRDHLLKAGFSVEQQLAAGLIKRSPERESTYDTFRNRLIFPIRDRSGRVLGFGGRVLDDSVPKYLNTAETPIFHKSQIVYGIDLAHAAIRDENRVVIVEGYMDVIAAHQHGFANVVACMGTALTAEHLRQLQRLTTNYVLALDADSAGQAATIRGLNQARMSLARKSRPTVLPGGRLEMTDRLGATLSIIQMPAGKDPDDVVRSDPALWRELVRSAQPLVDFYFGVVSRTYDVKTAQGKAAAVDELATLIAEVDDEIEQQHYIQQLSRMVQVGEAILLGQVHAAAVKAQSAPRPAPERPAERQGGGARPARAGQQGAPDDRVAPGPPDAGDWDPEESGYDAGWFGDLDEVAPPVPAAAKGRSADTPRRSEPHFDVVAHILALLLREPELLPWLTQKTSELDLAPPSVEDLERTEDKELFRALQLFLTSDELWDFESFQDRLEPSLHGRLALLASFGAHLPARTEVELREGVIKDIVHLRLLNRKRECETVMWLIDEAEQVGDRERSREHGAQYARLQRELDHLQPLMRREFLSSGGRKRSQSRLRA